MTHRINKRDFLGIFFFFLTFFLRDASIWPIRSLRFAVM